MKKLVLLSLVLIAVAGLASASAATCSVLMNPNTSGNNSSICTINVITLGDYISSLTLTGTDDYTGLQDPLTSPIVSFTGTLSPSAALTTPFGAPTFCNVTTSGANSVACAILPNPNPASNTDTSITSFSLQLTNAGNTVVGGAVTGASIVLHLDFAESPIPQTETPEPATFGMMGGALVGLGLLSRRKK
jgi:hypothetical protein